MSKKFELKGGTLNPIQFDPTTGVITKGFQTGNGVTQLAHKRKLSEIISLKTIPFAPIYRGQDTNQVFMSFIDGEKELNEAVKYMPETLRRVLFQTAGETLAAIHTLKHYAVPKSFHEGYFKHFSDLLEKTKPRLRKAGFNHLQLLDFLLKNYDAAEIEANGIVWTHGDYWLNNLIGEPNNHHHFKLNGVIDWELAGFNTPYKDFAVVKMSIEDVHADSSRHFWQGYGRKPNLNLQTHFAIVKTLEWIYGEDESNNFDSEFYQTKFAMIRNVI